MRVMMEVVHVFLFIIWAVHCAEIRKKTNYEVLTFDAALVEASLAENDMEIPSNREARLGGLITYLEEQSADVVCLSQIPFAQDVQRIVEGVKSVYLHSYSSLNETDDSLPPQANVKLAPSCNSAFFDIFYSCATDNKCVIGDENTQMSRAGHDCVAENCFEEFKKLGEEEACMSCLMSNSVDKYATRCAGEGDDPASVWNMNSLGLLLLSKSTLTEPSAEKFFPGDANVYGQGYIRAKVGDLHVGCTHVVPYLDYSLEISLLREVYRTYKEQNEKEIEKLIESFTGINPSIVLGNLNVGPEVPIMKQITKPVGAENYEKLTTAFNTKLANGITFASDNIYNAAGDARITDTITDHVFANGDATVVSATTVQRKMENGMPLSDHWALRANIELVQPTRQ